MAVSKLSCLHRITRLTFIPNRVPLDSDLKSVGFLFHFHLRCHAQRKPLLLGAICLLVSVSIIRMLSPHNYDFWFLYPFSISILTPYLKPVLNCHLHSVKISNWKVWYCSSPESWAWVHEIPGEQFMTNPGNRVTWPPKPHKYPVSDQGEEQSLVLL